VGFRAGLKTEAIEKKSFDSAENRTPVIQSVVRLSYPSSNGIIQSIINILNTAIYLLIHKSTDYTYRLT
jgi:hypothetical protein